MPTNSSIPTPREYSAEGLSSASLSLVMALIKLLIDRGTIDRAEAVALLDDLITAKDAKAVLHSSGAETEAADLLLILRGRLS